MLVVNMYPLTAGWVRGVAISVKQNQERHGGFTSINWDIFLLPCVPRTYSTSIQ